MLDWTDRSTCVLFGDGAGAVVLKADEETGILGTHLHADGAKKELLWNPVGVSVGFKPEEHNAGVKVLMTGNEVFKHAVKALDSVVEETLAARSEEHTSELQSLMRISYAVFCLKKKKNTKEHHQNTTTKTDQA